jgi:lysophospholipase L1-like esterase
MLKLLLKLLINKISKIIILITLIIVIAAILIELYFNTFRPNYHTFDENLGWKMKKNFYFSYKQKDFYNSSYLVNFSTNEEGLRPFGNKNKEGKKILILGDSFTMDPYASNNDMWYAVLANELSKNKINYYGYAAGAGGYGTFQQFILLDEIKKKLTPDIFILQFCSNDYMNNHYDWERTEGAMGQYIRRPYFEINDRLIKKKNIFYSIINSKKISELKIVNILIFQLSNLNHKIFTKTQDLEKINTFKNESNFITLELLIQIKSIYPNARAYIINCDPNDEKSQIFQNLVLKSNFILIPTGDKMNQYKLDKEKIFFKDGSHYNTLGNKLLGLEIYNHLKKIN